MDSVFDNKNNCFGCSSCVQICPSKAISFVKDNEGFSYPRIDGSKCTDCGLCRKACPIYEKPDGPKTENYPLAYAVRNKSDEIRSASTSGGVFLSLANKILSEGGIVFGVAFDGDLKAVHTEVETIDLLPSLQGSKYTQSYVGESCIKAKEALKSGRKVLFSGTPCQINGLYSYLGKNHDGLYTCDCICHGVPSPEVFELYKRHLEKVYSSEIESFSFRNKSKGWKSYHVGVFFKSGKKVLINFKEDPYMIGFIKNMYLRPSCHSCKYASVNRRSDITLADFWGIEKIHPHLDDDRGTSLILVNTEKGDQLVQACSNELEMHKSDVSAASRENPSLTGPSKPNKLREKFFSEMESHKDDFAVLQSKFLRPPSKSGLLLKKYAGFPKRLLKRVYKKLTS